MASLIQTIELDLANQSVREVNQYLHHDLDRVGLDEGTAHHIEIIHPDGNHSIAAGLNVDADIDIRGHAGYFVAGMNRQARVTIHGNVGWSVAENIMSGTVRVKGNASQSAAASGHGGLVIIEGDASSRCGISMKGVDIVVGGNVGHASGFMAQAGRLVICGDADAGLGDSLYEAVIYIAGEIRGLGADACEESMTEEDVSAVAMLLEKAEIQHDPGQFKRIASSRALYHWNADAGREY